MPVYNAGKYLRAAIDSVLSQSFRDFELILIDDGATDGSGMTCDEYAKKDSRVRVIHQSNKGICASRNIGIELANGEYIGFCDHDDEYLPGFLDTANEAIEKHGTDNTDCVKFNWATFIRLENGETAAKHNGMTCKAQKWTRKSGYALFAALTSVIWNGFYKAMLLRNHALHFDDSFKFGGEDFHFMQHLLSISKNVWWHEEKYYTHYINKGTSTSSTSHIKLANDYLRTINYEMSEFGNLGPAEEAMRMRRWLDNLCGFVLFAEGNRTNFIQKTKIISTYIRTLLPQQKARTIHPSANDDRSWRFFVFCAKHNLYYLASFGEALWHSFPNTILLASKVLIKKPKVILT